LNCQDNNELHERLTSFSEHVLPHYDDLEVQSIGDVRKYRFWPRWTCSPGKERLGPSKRSIGQLQGHTTDQLLEFD
jgi:hypothetical protein